MRNRIRYTLALTLIIHCAPAFAQSSNPFANPDRGLLEVQSEKRRQLAMPSVTGLARKSELQQFDSQFPTTRGTPIKKTRPGLDAVKRGQDRGGGNAVNDELFDFAEAGTRFKIETLAIAPKLNEVLFKLKLVSPQLSLKLDRAVRNSRWVFDTHPLSQTGCVNESLSGTSKTVVACQNQIEIRIFKPWFLNPKVSDRNKVGLLVHEAVRRIGYQDPFVTQVTRDIFDVVEDTISPSEFLDSVNSYAGNGVGRFMSRADSCRMIAVMRDSVDDYPKSGHMNLSKAAFSIPDSALSTSLFDITELGVGSDDTREQRWAAAKNIVRETSSDYGCLSQLNN